MGGSPDDEPTLPPPALPAWPGPPPDGAATRADLTRRGLEPTRPPGAGASRTAWDAIPGASPSKTAWDAPPAAPPGASPSRTAWDAPPDGGASATSAAPDAITARNHDEGPTRWDGPGPAPLPAGRVDPLTQWPSREQWARTAAAPSRSPSGRQPLPGVVIRLQAGTRLGPWILDAELGRGGMGAVWRATEAASGRVVALKLVLELGAEDAEVKTRFLREGQLAARLDHPGIVRVHTCGETEGLPWLSCELVPGARSLTKAAAGRPLAEGAALVRDAARALGAAHARGIVHRDVKPDNLLVDDQGRVRVTDFGLATALDVQRLTRSGTVMGTPAYMAPEQLQGDRDAQGPWTDVWALGVVLHEVLTGERPFGTGSPVELATRVLRGAKFRRPREVSVGIPQALEDVVLDALKVEVRERWPDGESMARALDAALAPPAPPAPAGGAALRAGLLVAGSVLALLAALAWQQLSSTTTPSSMPPPPVAPTPVAPVEPAPVAPVPVEPAPVDPAPVEPTPPVNVAPVWSTTVTIAFNDSAPPGHEHMQVSAMPDAVQAVPGRHLVFRGQGRLQVRFEVRGDPTWVQLELGHSPTNRNGVKDTYIDLTVNDRLVLDDHPPRGADLPIDLTGVARPGSNVMTFELDRRSSTPYWLWKITLRYGTGSPPQQD